MRSVVVAGIFAIAVSCATRPSGPPLATANDNRLSHHSVEDGVVTLRLVALTAQWRPGADTGRRLTVAAFALEGEAPSIPGPLLRLRRGERARLIVRNDLADTLVLCAPMHLRCVRGDTLRVAPGAVAAAEFVANQTTTSLYRAGLLRKGRLITQEDVQMSGGIVVDTSDAQDKRERVMVINTWLDPADTAHFVQMINGRTWPHTERVDVALGDSIRWRWINAGATEHPMHLHGFYFRVDTRGNVEQDTVFTSEQQQLAVTENLRPYGTATIVWAPSRSGNWLFHCHKAAHMSAIQQYFLAGGTAPDSLPEHGTANHMTAGMGGLVIAIRVSGPPSLASAPPSRRLRLLVQERAHGYGKESALGFVLDNGVSHPAPDSVEIPGPTLSLTRGEPVEITVVNRLHTATTVHWHGIELESYYDGVAGWSGAAQSVAPLIAPSDSFVARFTPPRSGTFMYHAHVGELRQIASGLYAPLLVIEPGQTRANDQVLLFSQNGPDTLALVAVNGHDKPNTIALRAGEPSRLRFINITAQDEIDGVLVRGADTLTWRDVAKDGATLSAARRVMHSAHIHLGPGETQDVEVALAPGDYLLRVASFNAFDVPVRVR
jgi:manganese oxidase